MASGRETLVSQQLSQIHAEIDEENRKKALVERSVQELGRTAARYENLREEDFDDGTEWKVRWETTHDYNGYLLKQTRLLEEAANTGRTEAKQLEKKLMELSGPEVMAYRKKLEQEKNDLHTQLRDYQWRYDQESKALYLANEERKNLLAVISQAKHDVAGMTHATPSQWWNYKV